MDRIVYTINEDFKIIYLSSNWDSFARDNGWTTNSSSKAVLGQSLWTFIADEETRYFYKLLLHKIQRKEVLKSIPFRCDSPKERRWLEMIISLKNGHHIEFQTYTIKKELRKDVHLPDQNVPGSEKYLKVCSMCKKILVKENCWLEIEEGLKELRIFETQPCPGVTHGICPECFNKAMGQ